MLTGAGITYSATVTASAPGSGRPRGTVGFFDWASSIPTCGAIALTSSRSSCTTTAPLQAGLHHMTAKYRGDTGFAPSASTPSTVRTLYGMGAFRGPLLQHGTLHRANPLHVWFRLENSNGSLVTAARVKQLSDAGGLTVILAGPGADVTASCMWRAVPSPHVGCTLNVPAGVHRGASYTVTAYEVIGGKRFAIPAVGRSGHDPVTISFT